MIKLLNRIFVLICVLLIKIYQKIVAPYFPSGCRHQPSCSQYMIEALGEYGFFKGLYFGVKRILRCNPAGTHGYDPVPKKD